MSNILSKCCAKNAQHVRLKNIVGEKDKTIKIKYESVYTQEVSYTFKDSAPVDYAPQFTWYVFRYTGIILFFIIGSEFFINYKINFRKAAKKED